MSPECLNPTWKNGINISTPEWINAVFVRMNGVQSTFVLDVCKRNQSRQKREAPYAKNRHNPRQAAWCTP